MDIPRRIQLPKLTQKVIENPDRPIPSKDTDLVIPNLPTKKSPGPEDFTGKFYKTHRKK